MCLHEGYHTGAGHYDPALRELRWVIECDRCGEQLVELSHEPYTPRFTRTPACEERLPCR